MFRRRGWSTARRRAGLDAVPRPYDLRHSFASLLLAEGRTVHYVAAQLGHSPALTLSTYGHLIAQYADAGPIDAEQEIAAAPLDDEPLTAEDLEAIEEARKDFAAGRWVSLEELRRELGVGAVRPGHGRAVVVARYAPGVGSSAEQSRPVEAASPAAVRDPLAVPEAVIDARRRPMSERLELALNWNTVASELRAGLAAVKRRTTADQ